MAATTTNSTILLLYCTARTTTSVPLPATKVPRSRHKTPGVQGASSAQRLHRPVFAPNPKPYHFLRTEQILPCHDRDPPYHGWHRCAGQRALPPVRSGSLMSRGVSAKMWLTLLPKTLLHLDYAYARNRGFPRP